MATGTATLDFGAFPGSSHATVNITGQTGILATSLVEAWLMPNDTADHSADEHIVETIKVVAGPPTAGIGFAIHGVNTSQLSEPVAANDLPGRFSGAGANPGRGQQRPDEPNVVVGGGIGTRLYGLWTVAWVWI
jgi:hypothetical protein